MAIPYLQNCAHQPDGWCLECVRIMGEEQDMLLEIVRSGSNLAMMAFEAKRKIRDLNDELQNERSSSVDLIRALEAKCQLNFKEGKKAWELLDAQTSELGQLRKANDEKDARLKRIKDAVSKITLSVYSPFSCSRCQANYAIMVDIIKELFPSSGRVGNGCSICNDPNCKTPGEQH